MNRLLFVVLINCTISHAMEDEFVAPQLFARIRKEHKDGICSQIKHLVHEANRPEVLDEFFLAHFTKSAPSGKAISAVQQRAQKIAKLFADNNISTCECINHLLEQKRDKALDGIKDAFSLSHADIENYKQRIAQIEQDASTKPLSVSFVDNGLPVELQQRIHDKARDMGITDSIDVTTSWFWGSSVRNKVPFDMQSGMLLNLNLGDLSTSWWAMFHRRFLDSNSDHCRMVGDATIDHELTHIKKLAQERNFELLRLITKEEKPDEARLLEYCKQYPDSERGGKAFLKEGRVQESEADRIAPACGTCNNSYSSFIMWNNYFVEQRKTDAIVNEKLKLAFEKMKELDPHPRLEKRLLWAAVIYWLKVAETE